MGKEQERTIFNILSTLQLFINIVAVNKVVCDKFTSQVVSGSEFRIV